jgi:hypothetical protein
MTKQRLQAFCADLEERLAQVFTTKTGAVGPPRHGGTRRARSLKPEVQGLEGRQLLSGFARGVEGGTANDMTVYRPSNGTWYVAEAATGFQTSPGHLSGPLVVPWGQTGDIPIPNSDFFGDGRADYAVFRPSNCYWYVKDPFTGQIRAIPWGAPGDVPIARAHFGGGPWDDMAVYRPSNQTWYVLTGSSGFNPSAAIETQWGAPGDIPIFNSDYFGYGHDDFVVFRPSNGTWYVKDPSSSATISYQWGQPGDVPLAGSNFFVGHVTDDFAVYRPSNGTWYIRDPYSSATIIRQWGQPGDVPLANADFDGDSQSDIAVFRPSDGTWHVLTSSSGFNLLYQIQRQWGASGDEAIGGPAAVDPVLILTAGAQYRSFQGYPLFASDGPSPSDIAQGGIGDCSVLSRLHAVAANDPARIRRSIFDMGNGLYGVDLQPYGQDQYVVVNADLPTDSSGNLKWAHLGHQNSLWVALIEKAWTFAKPVPSSVYLANIGTDKMLDGSGFSSLWDAMRFTSSFFNAPYLDPNLEATLASGQSVVACTVGQVSAGSQLVSQHCYDVVSVNYAWQNGVDAPATVTLYNPWGFLVTVSYSDFEQNVSSEASAYV